MKNQHRFCRSLVIRRAVAVTVCSVSSMTQWPAIAAPALTESDLASDQWPLAPFSAANLKAPRKPSTEKPVMVFDSPVFKPPADDPLMESPPTPLLHGTFLYAPLIKHDNLPGAQQYFVLRGIGVERKGAGQPASVATYHIQTAIRIFDPQMSPDGKYILFKGGWPFDTTGTYALYLWDVQAKMLKQLTSDSISYYDVFWSPDGKFVAYVQGGDRNGKVWGSLSQQRLHILDIDTGKSRRVLKNPGATDVAWTQQDTLLMTMRPKNPKIPERTDDNDKADPAVPEPKAPAATSIYEVPARGGKAQLLITRGYNPVPSPDGNQVAFLSKADSPDGFISAEVPELFVYDRQKKSRVSLGRYSPNYVRWTANGRSIILIEGKYGKGKEGKGEGSATISTVDPVTRITKKIAVLHGQDYQVVPKPERSSEQFCPLAITRDGRFLVMSETDVIGFDLFAYTLKVSIIAVDLKDGSATTVTSLLNKWASINGYSWHDES